MFATSSYPLTMMFSLLLAPILANILKQLFFRDPHRPPVVWHWIPKVGSTVEYGQDPYKFFFKCQEKYGDVFTFGLLGMQVTVFLGTKGNNFILNGKLKDLNAEEVYGPLTIPIFGRGVVYDVDNARFMDQKRLLKEGFSSQSLRAYVPQFVNEVEQYVGTNVAFRGENGVCDISSVLSEISLYAAAGSLQGKEVRDSFDATFATHYRHLDDGFAPINFMFPWLPIPVNRRRDRAQRKMSNLYLDIIKERRSRGNQDGSHDMLWALLGATYKNGDRISDEEMANLMIALLMGGQHNTAASGTWIMLELAHRPHLVEELYREQNEVLGGQSPSYESLQKLTLHNNVIRETLRLHSPIHSVMRKVKQPMHIPDTDFVVPTGHILLAAPGLPARTEEYFPDPMNWDPHRWDRPTTIQQIETPDGDTIDYGYGDVSSKAAYSPYLPFGAGRHRCVGEIFAYSQLGAILVTLVRLLQWEQVDPEAAVPATDYSVSPFVALVVSWAMPDMLLIANNLSPCSLDQCTQQPSNGDDAASFEPLRLVWDEQSIAKGTHLYHRENLRPIPRKQVVGLRKYSLVVLWVLSVPTYGLWSPKKPG
ncbi:cytochrome P450, family 51 (sterol 14-demethylase) [Exophiala aquamarina CBS 119918]|uniref:sterol 14alpha-demethylase n=1 Tax=Exophiala aquamarina CBS 119918 TaxID=1182545 RepID=A0A072P885_9EURO|nr:cytochrome P450, family 51 (sterol 14-demethylase) [Exophiala aquamarina CBS 119918]KEF56274.1 cytochrome P450, family 51 (sterol 14-demethylase) [Exophiala aquamarina CBS 119918]